MIELYKYSENSANSSKRYKNDYCDFIKIVFM